MQLEGNTVLVTGGASGIGLAVAARYLRAGSEVIICGRREQKLREAAREYPGLQIVVCDVASAAGRIELMRSVAATFPRFNVLVNNAGIQRRVKIADEPWEAMREELAINLEAPIHLSQLAIPHLGSQPRAAIVNVTSGLSFVPMARVPIYCATKAALHSFTLSLRHQLIGTAIEVIEIIPPAVDTDLGGPGLHTHGVNVDEFADSAMGEIASGAVETAYGFSKHTSRASRAELDATFVRMNSRE